MAKSRNSSNSEASPPPEDAQSAAAVRKELWDSYFADRKSEEIKDKLIREYLFLVKAELRRMSYHLPRHIDTEELYSDGAVGLLSAMTNFDPSIGVDFEIYARKRIWGAMLDRVRALDGVPRSARQASRKIDKAVTDFLNENDRQPDETELAEELELTVEELHDLERQAGLTNNFSLEAFTEGDSGGKIPIDDLVNRKRDEVRPHDRLSAQELKSALVDGLKTIPERERHILVLYYTEGLMLKEIAAAMEVSESRVSQLHSRGLMRLRSFLEFREAKSDQPTSTKSDPKE